MSIRASFQLTRFKIGSIRELCVISIPLILAFICNGMMMIIDRIIIGYYSFDAVCAITTASSASFSFLILPLGICSISEVFVGKYNGQNKPQKMGSSCWQMIWLSLFLAPVFLLIALIFKEHLFANIHSSDFAKDYFAILVGFGSIFCLQQSIIGFFIARGKVKFITFAIIASNIFNILLDLLFVFGTPYSPALGPKGAAVATIISQLLLFLILALNFFDKKNRVNNGTLNWRYEHPFFVKILKTGFASSLAHLSECFCFFYFFKLMSSLEGSYLKVAVIMNSIYMIAYFIIEGISKAVTAISSNLIGGSESQLLKKVVLSGFKLQILFTLLLSTLLYFFHDSIFSVFYKGEIDTYINDFDFQNHMKISSIYLCLGFLFDGVTWVVIGVLVSLADLRFITLTGSVSPWLLLILPLVICLNFFKIPEGHIWSLFVTYAVLNFSISYLRFILKTRKKDLSRKLPDQSLQPN